MNWLDILLMVVVGLSMLVGVVKGFARVGIGFLAAILGILCGLWFCGVAGSFLRPYVRSNAIADFVGFLLVFLAVVLGGALLGKLLEKLFKWAGLSWLNRLMGGTFGLLRGFVCTIAIVLALMAFSPTSPPRAVVQSQFAPYVIDGARVCASLAPNGVKEAVRKSYREIRQAWTETLKKGIRQLPDEEI